MAYNKGSKIKKATKYKTPDRGRNERDTTTNSSSKSSESPHLNTPKKLKRIPVSRKKKVKTVTCKITNKKSAPKRVVEDAKNQVSRKNSMLEIVNNKDSNLKKLFHEVISDLMARKDRHTILQYVCFTSTPDREEQEINSESSAPSLGPFPAEIAKSHRTSTQSWNQNSLLSNNKSPSPNLQYINSKNSERSRRSSTSDKSKPSGNNSLYFNGPEYVRWASKNEQTKSLKRVALPEDLRQSPIPIKGVFRSQLMKYRTDAKKRRDKSQLPDFKKVVKETYARPGNDDFGWNSSKASDSIAPQKTPVSQSSKPKKKSDSFKPSNLDDTARSEGFKGRHFDPSQSMKSPDLQIPPVDQKTKLDSSTLASFFTPQSHSTPKATPQNDNYLAERHTSSDSVLVIPKFKKSRQSARTSQSLVNSRSSSVTSAPSVKRQPWLVEAAKKLEGAHSQGKSAVLSSSYLSKRPMINISNDSVLPLETSVTEIDKKAPLSDIENINNNEEPSRIFHHKKNIHLRMMIDQDKPLEADCSITFDSTEANPVIKIIELRVDDRDIAKTSLSSISKRVNKLSTVGISPQVTRGRPPYRKSSKKKGTITSKMEGPRS